MDEQANVLDLDTIRRVPKVLLHEHLDGGLRPETVQELAREIGYDGLPKDCETDAEALSDWFFRGASRGSLPQYLEGFRHTIALMQTAPALERIAFECMEDLAADGVVYAEVRFAPDFHTSTDLGLDGVMTAVLRGLKHGADEFGVGFGLIVCAMRNASPELSEKLVELAVSFRNRGCMGFDLAGEEAGNPAKDHVRAFQYAQRANFSITIHAGESFGPESIWQALQFCGAHRIGHGTRLIEDIVIYDKKVIQVGALAQYVLDHRIPLEICLSSNLHTGATPSMAEHPFPYFLSAGYRVTLNTDNRLMSRTTLSDEYAIANRQFGCDMSDLELLSLNAMKSAFASYGERCRFIYNRIKPGFANLREELGMAPDGGSYLRPH
jgi:adenosine deaminase